MTPLTLDMVMMDLDLVHPASFCFTICLAADCRGSNNMEVSFHGTTLEMRTLQPRHSHDSLTWHVKNTPLRTMGRFRFWLDSSRHICIISMRALKAQAQRG